MPLLENRMKPNACRLLLLAALILTACNQGTAEPGTAVTLTAMFSSSGPEETGAPPFRAGTVTPPTGASANASETAFPKRDKSEVEFFVALMVYDPQASSAVPNLGQDVELVLESVPVGREVILDGSGQVTGTSTSPWVDHPVTEMRVCVSTELPCTPKTDWIPFTASPDSAFAGGSRLSVSIPVDWIGPKTVYLAAEFRGVQGQPIPAAGFDSDNKAPSTGPVRITFMLTGVRDRNVPVDGMPFPAQTSLAVTQAAMETAAVTFPVTGSVQIEGGRSAVGGTAGKRLDIRVEFSASSPFGAVTDMRLKAGGTCQPEKIDISGAAWEPFEPVKTFPFTPAINWVGFTIAVQYRDERGNLSEITCDDISVEGMPPQPTP